MLNQVKAEEKPEIILRRKAMDLLARREQSYQELQNKLEQRFPEHVRDGLIFSVLDRLRDEKLQSDTRFTESYVRYRRSKGHGPLKIDAELKQKGVSSSQSQAYLYTDDVDWFEEACKQLQKKIQAQDAELITLAQRQKYYRFLHQRGFDHEQIQHAIQQFSQTHQES